MTGGTPSEFEQALLRYLHAGDDETDTQPADKPKTD